MFIQAADKEGIAKIHATSLRILDEIGVVVPHDEMLTRFADHGAAVDRATKRVRIPASLVTSLLAKAGKSYTLYGRDLAKKAEFGLGKSNYNSIAGEALWVEEPGEERRYASIENVATAARLADALEMITIPGAMADPHEMPTEWRCVAVVAEMLKNTTKPVTFWFHDRASARYIVDLVTTLRGGQAAAEKYPLCYPFLEPISPLSFPFDGIDLLFETAKINMPVSIGPMAQMGVSAPCTIAGTLAVENAEILAGVCITQLIREGTPVCYGGICHAFDMATTQMIFSGPEQAIFGVLATQLGKSYGLPVYINVGLTDSKLPDAQAGLEIATTLGYGRAAGADIFGHMGICGVDQATSLDILVLQNEIIRYLESANRKIAIDDDTLAFDVIREVGPKGMFIEHTHTYEHFRGELFFPKLLDRNFFDRWRNNGAESMQQRCNRRKKELLASHVPAPLESGLAREIDGIVAAAKKHLQPKA